jgi:alpha/beta superfamily hydrolase
MPAHTENTSFDGLAGLIDCAIDWPEGVPTGWALILHPNPSQGGTREQFRVRYPEIAAKPWVLGGFSFGTSIGVQLYAQWDKLGRNLPNIVILTGSAALRFRHSEAKAPEDALVIHGELDEVVPLSEVMEWARPLGMPVVVIPEAGHFFHGKLLVLRQLVQTRLKALV